ncbi:transcription factor mef2A isoform X1 [Drosophila santomea]|uniref:transcription factor mef2A isoform X1 n=1 Tax=Drosophila santomea TaxID=129105 RepID=UPI001953D16E|nr:transcription factor mef2A isoform X1 [Drosophila santomea]
MATRQDDEIGEGGSDSAPFRVLPHTDDIDNYLAHQQQHQNQGQNFLIHQQQHGQAPVPLMWPPPPPHLAAPQFAPHLQQQQPQPHLYNEYLFNLSYSGQSGQPETYSVLPVGHGNFLKVYHCPDNQVNEAGAPLFTHINMASINHHHLQHQHQAAPPTPPQPTPLYELFATNPLTLPKAQQQDAHHRNPQQTPNQVPTVPQVNHSSSSANLLINNLVNNWSPNLTGGSYIQFGGEANENDIHHGEPSAAQQPQAPNHILQQPEPLSQSVNTLPAASKPAKPLKMPLATATVSPSAINKSSVAVPVQPEGKKRIVAEVKPMPMSYSDVLSKGTKPSAAGNEGEYSTQPQRRLEKEDGYGIREMRTSKRSPLHDAKETGSFTAGVGHAHASRGKKRGQINQTASLKVQQSQYLPQSTLQSQIKLNKLTNQEKKRPLQPKNVNTNAPKASEQKTTSASVPANSSLQNHTNGIHFTPTTSSSTSRKSGNNKINSNASHSNHSGPNPNAGTSNNSSSVNYSSNNNVSSSSSKRYSSSNLNPNNSSGYSYSSKRNRSNAYSSTNSPTHANSFSSNRNYELAKRILHTWWIYTLKLLTWLFYLVYDIVVLGFSMGYERMTLAYMAALVYARQLQKELKQNSGKPSIWWRSYWRRFDSRFAKNSRLAIWRRFYKRKPPEPTSEQFKTGRLPQTGEEAMCSLLNCKGKDAYSILGVPPDSSQEQIRKHYKKIAVLVHPDKNKQAGAEEAFKVLQRAFELIGEPENRLMYDQSIAETLHTEKAWTELHDLLSQLQTKMAEAVNTIRCSTCAQRHPRKLTERPHYAARECASCKIRHSAKDGDIWAETSIMGLRWKYLALMDGKVYDITEWANCQKGALSHLEPNSHMVQYRIVRGAQQQQQQQQQHHQHPQQQHNERGMHHPGGGVSGVSEATLHEFLDNLYSGQHPGTHNVFAGNARRRTRRN